MNATVPAFQAAREEQAEAFSLAAVAVVLLRHIWLIVGIPTAMVLWTIVPVLTGDRSYVASSTFLPHGVKASGSDLQSLASQFGVSVGDAGSESLDFYVLLIKSRNILRDAVVSKYNSPRGEKTLQELYAGDFAAALPVRSAMERLRAEISVTPNQRAAVIALHTTAATPALAEQINRRILDLLSQFNLATRQSQAAAERRFVESRLRAAESALAAAEEDLQRFLVRNRQYANAPHLSLELDRYQQRVRLRQQLHASLSQAYEQARIAEVRNTPVITIVEAPEGSADLTRRGLRRKVSTAFLVGIFVALMLAFVLEYVARERQTRPGDFEELRRLGSRIFRRAEHRNE